MCEEHHTPAKGRLTNYPLLPSDRVIPAERLFFCRAQVTGQEGFYSRNTHMDWTTIITVICTALCTGGGLSAIFFRRENKRSKQLANESASAQQWKELYEQVKADKESLSGKVDNLYKENGRLRDNNNDLTTEAAVLKIFKCKVIGCEHREPPLGSQTKNRNNENK